MPMLRVIVSMSQYIGAIVALQCWNDLVKPSAA